jgi:hypothetical protein
MTEQDIKRISQTVANKGKVIATLNNGRDLIMPPTTLGTMHRVNSLLADIKMDIIDEKMNIHSLMVNNLDVVVGVISEAVHNAPNCPDSLRHEISEHLIMDQLEEAVLSVLEALDIKRFFMITTLLNQVRIRVSNTQDQTALGLS